MAPGSLFGPGVDPRSAILGRRPRRWAVAAPIVGQGTTRGRDQHRRAGFRSETLPAGQRRAVMRLVAARPGGNRCPGVSARPPAGPPAGPKPGPYAAPDRGTGGRRDRPLRGQPPGQGDAWTEGGKAVRQERAEFGFAPARCGGLRPTRRLNRPGTASMAPYFFRMRVPTALRRSAASRFRSRATTSASSPGSAVVGGSACSSAASSRALPSDPSRYASRTAGWT